MGNIELDLKQMFERRAGDVDVSGHISASLRSRARLQRFATISSALLLVVLSVGGGFLGFRQIARDSKVPPNGTINPSGHNSTYTDGNQIPDEARLLCTRKGVTVLTPEVRPRQDGVHIRFDNRSRKRAFYLRPASSTAPMEWGSAVPHSVKVGPESGSGFTSIRTGFPPGEIVVGCFRTGHGIPSWPSESRGLGRLKIVDPEGLWVSSGLHCPRLSIHSRVTASPVSGGTPDLQAMARQYITGIQPDDHFERSGYPHGNFLPETLLLTRDGKPIAGLSFSQEHGSWEIAVRTCAESGVGTDGANGGAA
jgi:hypothetical protein